jgi:hypothetical protein
MRRAAYPATKTLLMRNTERWQRGTEESFLTQFGLKEKKLRVRPKSREEPGCGERAAEAGARRPEGGT